VLSFPDNMGKQAPER